MKKRPGSPTATVPTASRPKLSRPVPDEEDEGEDDTHSDESAEARRIAERRHAHVVFPPARVVPKVPAGQAVDDAHQRLERRERKQQLLPAGSTRESRTGPNATK